MTLVAIKTSNLDQMTWKAIGIICKIYMYKYTKFEVYINQSAVMGCTSCGSVWLLCAKWYAQRGGIIIEVNKVPQDISLNAKSENF